MVAVQGGTRSTGRGRGDAKGMLHTVVAALEDVALHLVVEVAGTGVDRASEKLGDVLLGGGEAVRNLRHGYG